MHPIDILDSFRDTFTEYLIDNISHPIRTHMRNFLREQSAQLDEGFPSTTLLKDILHITLICTPLVAVREQRRTGSPAPGLSNYTDLPANIASGILSINSRLPALEDKVNEVDVQFTFVVENQLGPSASRGQQTDHWSVPRSADVPSDPAQKKEPPYATTHHNSLQRTYALPSRICSAYNHPSQPFPSFSAFSQQALHAISQDHHHFAPPQHYPVYNPSILDGRRLGMPSTERFSPVYQSAPHRPQVNLHRNIGLNTQPVLPNIFPVASATYKTLLDLALLYTKLQCVLITLDFSSTY